MRVLIIGAGRMGIRHAQGILNNDGVSEILITDINNASLENAKTILNNSKVIYSLNSDVDFSITYDTCVIASTANDRIGQLNFVAKFKPTNILVEKPLGQSWKEVEELEKHVLAYKLNCSVNLNMRLYDSFNQLKNNLKDKPQLNGKKTITINTGTLGIGANGIHYLDLLYFLLDADSAKIVSAKIEDELVPSGRGPAFGDFGGWAVINFYKDGADVGTTLISISNHSTAFGSWEIVAPNGRVWFNEVDQKCIYSLRKEDSQLPISRYYGDYLPNEELKFEAPFLGDLTNKWINNIIINGKSNLPSISESKPVHQLMFDWLSKSKTHSKIFPIT